MYKIQNLINVFEKNLLILLILIQNIVCQFIEWNEQLWKKERKLLLNLNYANHSTIKILFSFKMYFILLYTNRLQGITSSPVNQFILVGALAPHKVKKVQWILQL